MSEKKFECLVYGFLRENCIKWIYNDIINIIIQFYNDKIACKLFISSKFKHKNINERIIDIYTNHGSYIGINDQHKLYINEYMTNNITNYQILQNKSINIASKGHKNKSVFIYTLDNELYGALFDSTLNNYGKRSFELMDTSIMKSDIIQITCGNSHTLFLTQLGNVYGNGDNTWYQLSNQFDLSKNVTLTRINKLHNIDKIGCGNMTSYVVNKDGIMYTFGSNYKGKLGIGKRYNELRRCGRLNEIIGIKIKLFSVIYANIGCLTSNNEIYFFGANYQGQCGILNAGIILKPTKLNLNVNNIIDIKCGGQHTFIQTGNNQYYSMGKNTNNCLLLNPDKFGIREPTLINNDYITKLTGFNGDIIDIIPGSQITYILQKI